MDYSGQMIIITPEEKIISKPYRNVKDIQNAVEGIFQILDRGSMPVLPELFGGEKEQDYVVYCNDEFLYNSDMNTVNAAAVLLTDKVTYGNIVVLKEYEDDDREIHSQGFEYFENGEKSECWYVENLIKQIIADSEKKLNELHEKYDDNKPDPHIEFVSFR